MVQRILIIDDEPGLRLTLSDRLQKEGYGVETASDGDSGFKQAVDGGFDLILLDLMLPKKNGMDVCRDLRQLGISTPILMLTARSDTVDKVVGLKIGADDYLTKPFDMLELLARLEALLRRHSKPVTEEVSSYEFGSIVVDFRKTTVTRDGEAVPVSAKEFKLLRYLIQNRGATIIRAQLLCDVWSYCSATSTRTVDVHIAWLRQKLEHDPKHPEWIVTVHRMGYKFLG
jgi:two-component system alkaline phosphatase synthesis response regulator PhoP